MAHSGLNTDISKRNAHRVPRRLLGTLLAGISAGVVPRAGAPYIAIGRVEEIHALTDDLTRVAAGESSMRFLIGRYGSGKSFLIQLMRARAMEMGFVVADADLSPERKLSGEGGLATYRELSRNLAVKASPDGGAWGVLLGRWFAALAAEIPDTAAEEEYKTAMREKVAAVLSPLSEEIGGFDYIAVLTRYLEAYLADDADKMAACLCWLRGEFRTKTDARAALGLRAIGVITDANWYLHLRLLARFVRLIGQSGLVVFIDECVNLYKIANRISREANYEKILSMYNDTLQGVAEGLMIVLGGTPRFLEDTRRGLFSYEALRSRLTDGRFAAANPALELKNMMSPVIRLRRLSDNELFALLLRLSTLHAEYYGTEMAVTDEERALFLREELSRAGADEMITPREIIRDFVTLLDLLYQNPGVPFHDIMATTVDAAPRGENLTAEISEASFAKRTDALDAPAPPVTPPPAVSLDDLEF